MQHMESRSQQASPLNVHKCFIRICIFEGRTSYPSLVPLLLLIYILYLITKKEYIYNTHLTTNYLVSGKRVA